MPRKASGRPRLGDFTTRPRVLTISAIAVVVGFGGVAAAVVLLSLIQLATNIAYFGQFSFAPLKMEHHHLGAWAVLAPIVGALIVGLMARYGSGPILVALTALALAPLLIVLVRLLRRRRHGAAATGGAVSRSASD